MNIIQTGIKDLLIIEPKVFGDNRGYFYESYSNESFKAHYLNYNFIQDNQSLSSYGTIRGLHFQKGEHAQAKLVRAVVGKVLDVVVDIRTESETFGKVFSVELSEENHRQLLVPRGFAHGFSVLSKTALFQYKVDNIYNKNSEGGILYNDSELDIDWMIASSDIQLSDKDKVLPTFKELRDQL